MLRVIDLPEDEIAAIAVALRDANSRANMDGAFNTDAWSRLDDLASFFERDHTLELGLILQDHD